VHVSCGLVWWIPDSTEMREESAVQTPAGSLSESLSFPLFFPKTGGQVIEAEF